MYNYVEIIKGRITQRGEVAKLPDGQSNIDLDYYGKTIQDGFHSVFMQSQEFKDYVDEHKTVMGYDGDVGIDYLYWDLDNHDPIRAIEDTIELIERLKAFSQDNIRVYFSGNKGFHVIYYCPELKNLDIRNLNDYIKMVCKKIANNIRSFDAKIYDKTRVIRTINSIHSKTKLHKIPVTYEELLNKDPDALRELAKKQRKLSSNDFNQEINDEVVALLQEVLENGDGTEQSTANFNGIEILEGISNGFEKGNRNSGLASIAGMLHNRNIDDNFIAAILSSINNNSQNPLPQTDINTIVSSIGRYSVDAKYQQPQSSDIATMEQAGQSWYNIINNAGKCDFGNRFPHINNRMGLVIPGDVIGIVADSGVGKTIFGMELGNNEAKAREKYSLFMSLEMSKAGVFFRAATIESEGDLNNYVPSSDVAKNLLKNTGLAEKVHENWKNILIADKGGISIDKVSEYFYKAQDMTGNNISNVVIDYAQNLDKAEDIQYSMRMARKFKELAKELNTVLFVLMQCNKMIPDSYTEVKKNYIEGAGAYFQACDYILGFWRSRDENNRLHASLIKDRWGTPEYYFDLVRNGLKYHSEDYQRDTKQRMGAL